MNTGHLSEMELQQYALEPSGCSTGTLGHMEACSSCRAEAAAYRLLFTGIGEQPVPKFDFDLSAAVLSRLSIGAEKLAAPVPIPRISTPQNATRFGPGAWSIGLLSCCTVVIPLYLFRKNIGSMFDDSPLFFMYSAVAAAGIIVLSRLIGMYRNYLRQLETLNF